MRALARRGLYLPVAAALLPVVGLASTSLASGMSEWDRFKLRFLLPEGRIRDTANGDISHSEGQAWGMLLAARHGDRDAFDLIQRWTRRNLAVRSDSLLAWRYRPGFGVEDLNNATDGDLYHAWALLVAYRQWQEPRHLQEAQRVAADILRLTVRQVGGRTVLLPGVIGFESATHVDVNPSYYAFGAIDALQTVLPSPIWGSLARDGLSLLAAGRFGRWALPPDLLRISIESGVLSPLSGRGDRVGYDAVRVPLNLVWGGRITHPVVAAAARFWCHPDHPYLPAWTRFIDGQISPDPAGTGVLAITRLTLMDRSGVDSAAAMPQVDAAQHYYDAVLTLLAREAWADARRPARAA